MTTTGVAAREITEGSEEPGAQSALVIPQTTDGNLPSSARGKRDPKKNPSGTRRGKGYKAPVSSTKGKKGIMKGLPKRQMTMQNRLTEANSSLTKNGSQENLITEGEIEELSAERSEEIEDF